MAAIFHRKDFSRLRFRHPTKRCLSDKKINFSAVAEISNPSYFYVVWKAESFHFFLYFSAIHSAGLWRVSCSNLEVNAFRLFFGRGINQKTFRMEKKDFFELIRLSGWCLSATCIESEAELRQWWDKWFHCVRHEHKQTNFHSPHSSKWRHFIFIIF